jgi:hypothetical protein
MLARHRGPTRAEGEVMTCAQIALVLLSWLLLSAAFEKGSDLRVERERDCVLYPR